MACFIVPAATALIVTAAEKAEEKKEISLAEKEDQESRERVIPLSAKLKWFANLLWGGVVLLLFEHIWHGEVVPWAPFLTAMSSAEATADMLREMATVGVTMTLLIAVVWTGMCFAAEAIVKRPEKAEERSR